MDPLSPIYWPTEPCIVDYQQSLNLLIFRLDMFSYYHKCTLLIAGYYIFSATQIPAEATCWGCSR